jgi:hypothetical protein
MNVNIDGLGSRQPPASLATTATGAASGFASVLNAARQDAVSVELDSSFPATPPPEVTLAINRASDAYDRLNATGQQVHFIVDSPGGTVVVELQDLDGNPLGTISGSDALRIAGGESLN